MKAKEFYKSLGELLQENPSYGDLELVYSTDDEGNDYHHVNNYPTAAQFHDMEEYFLELVGYKGEDTIADEDINGIIIN